MALAAATPLALSFMPGHLRPALHAARVQSPAMLLGGATTWLADAAASGAVLLPETSNAAAAAATQAVAEEPGLFDYVLVKPFESAIESVHSGLAGAGVGGAWGLSIILFTLLLKALTFPLNKQQIMSTTKMQAIQPAAKQLQEKYRNKDPARLNLELQKLYADNEVNPLAGCLPSLAQIPIFIGLYRSVLNLAKEDKLTEGFLWLPSLEGPVSDYQQGVGWLFGDEAQGYAWNGLTPPLGWDDTLAYLTLPVLLVISQYVSTQILTPKSDDPAQQQTQAILKVLPLMIGWFSLNVPSGLGLYWLVNNVVTTSSTLLIRRSVTPAIATAGADVGATAAAAAPPKPQGFGRAFGEVVTKNDGATTVTITPPGTRKERRAAAKAESSPAASATVIEAVAEPVPAEAEAATDVEAHAAAEVDGGVAPAAKAAPTLKKKKKKTSKKKKN